MVIANAAGEAAIRAKAQERTLAFVRRLRELLWSNYNGTLRVLRASESVRSVAARQNRATDVYTHSKHARHSTCVRLRKHTYTLQHVEHTRHTEPNGASSQALQPPSERLHNHQLVGRSTLKAHLHLPSRKPCRCIQNLTLSVADCFDA